jgi:copper(I)-binding protein
MIRAAVLSLALLVTPAFAQEVHDDHAEEHHDEHDHEDHDDDHVAEVDGIRTLHAWANATNGSTALVYVEIENGSDAEVILTGGETDIAQSVELVGLQNSGGELSYTSIPEMPIAAGSEMVLSPNGLALQLNGLSEALVEGEHFHIDIEFGDIHLDTSVEIQSATATQHSHAGHNH